MWPRPAAFLSGEPGADVVRDVFGDTVGKRWVLVQPARALEPDRRCSRPCKYRQYGAASKEVRENFRRRGRDAFRNITPAAKVVIAVA